MENILEIKPVSRKDLSTLKLTTEEVAAARKAAMLNPNLVHYEFAEVNMVLYKTGLPPEFEQWQRIPIPDTKYEYFVSNLGNVCTRHAQLLQQFKNPKKKHAYLKCRIYIDGKRIDFKDVHQIIADVWLKKPLSNESVELRHLNSNPHCNCVDNLAYGTKEQNYRDKYSLLRGKEVTPNNIEKFRPHPFSPGLWAGTHGNLYQVYYVIHRTSGYYYKSSYRSGGRKHVSIKMYSAINEKPIYRLLHRLVWEAFHGPIPIEKMVLHIDDNPHNNRLDNLYLGDAKENTWDRKRNGKMLFGERHPNFRYTDAQVQIFKDRRKKMEDEESIRETGRLFGISESSAYAINSGRNRSIV